MGVRSRAPTGEGCRAVGKQVGFSASQVFLCSPRGSAAAPCEALPSPGAQLSGAGEERRGGETLASAYFQVVFTQVLGSSL